MEAYHKSKTVKPVALTQEIMNTALIEGQKHFKYEFTKRHFIHGFKKGFECAREIITGSKEEEKETEVQICYKSQEPCKYDCPGLCKESV